MIIVVYTFVALATLAGLLYVSYRIGVNVGDRNFRQLKGENRSLKQTIQKIEQVAEMHDILNPELYAQITDIIRNGKELE